MEPPYISSIRRRASQLRHAASEAGLILIFELPPPRLPAAVWFKLCGHGLFVQHGIIALFGFGGRDIADRFQKAPVVEHGVIAVRLSPAILL